MFFKIFTVFSLLFVLIVAIFLGNQIYMLSGQIGQKDRTNLQGLLRSPNSTPSISEVKINNHALKVELADTPEKRAKGLMERSSLSANSGMLFIFSRESFYSFWMKNTSIPLDIIWINKDRQVVYIEKNVPPCIELVCKSYSSPREAFYVLETNAGWASRAKVEVGSIVEFN